MRWLTRGDDEVRLKYGFNILTRDALILLHVSLRKNDLRIIDYGLRFIDQQFALIDWNGKIENKELCSGTV